MDISIHALREEGDVSASTSGAAALNFYPRPPRGGRQQLAYRAALDAKFLSTPSARRATQEQWNRVLKLMISIHALREEGDCEFPPILLFLPISIHALREEGDLLVLRLSYVL